MNQVFLIGRLTKDPDVKEKLARYTLAVDRAYKKDGEASADFINIITFGKNRDFAEKYLTKGMKILVKGHIVTGKYEKGGQTVFTTSIVADGHEFIESKKSAAEQAPEQEQKLGPNQKLTPSGQPYTPLVDWMTDDQVTDEDLPFE